MLNTQIPSGLQALMQAAQILQQQASPSAPGPQGQQPTVAKQVEQAAAQQAMPDMQSVGQQAGIAGQMMAQRQQQQQQMAQDPQAVAQMAAQMLQRGIGGLPANMQFREGGIIGYAGPEGSDVRLQPIPDREPAEFDDSLSAKAQREIAEMEAGQRVNLSRDVEVFMSQQRRDGNAEYAERERQRMLQESRTMAQPYVAKPDLPAQYTPYPVRGPMRATTSAPGIAAVLESEFQRGAEAGPEPRPAPRAEPRAELRPEARPEPGPETLAVPSGIAAVAPRTRPTFQDIAKSVPEDEEAKKYLADREAINRRMLETRRRQADLAQEGIAAIGKTETERKRLLELQRSEDALNSFIRLGQALRTGGDQYMAYSAGMKARDEADRVATLAGQEAVLKLKQAQQAREMGDLEMEKKFLDEAASYKKQVDDARRLKAKDIADFEKSIIPAEIQSATAAANRAQELQLKMADLKQRAEDAKDVKLANQVRLASEGLASAQRKIAQTLKDEFPNYAQIVSLQGISGKLDDNQRKVITDYETRKRELEASSIAPIEALITKLAKQSGLELPEAKPAPSAAPAIRYNAQGQRIQ
jgi:hypothetical protein